MDKFYCVRVNKILPLFKRYDQKNNFVLAFHEAFDSRVLKIINVRQIKRTWSLVQMAWQFSRHIWPK